MSHLRRSDCDRLVDISFKIGWTRYSAEPSYDRYLLTGDRDPPPLVAERALRRIIRLELIRQALVRRMSGGKQSTPSPPAAGRVSTLVSALLDEYENLSGRYAQSVATRGSASSTIEEESRAKLSIDLLRCRDRVALLVTTGLELTEDDKF